MKKLIVVFLLILLCSEARADWCVYRKNGGEVLIVSINQQNINDTYFGEVSCANGIDIANPKRKFDGANVVNALAQDITNFPIFQDQDDLAIYRNREKEFLTDGNRQMAVIKALALTALDEINILRSQAGLQPRTKTQLYNAIKAKIDAGNAD